MALVLNKLCTGFCSCKTGIHAIRGNKRSKCALQTSPEGAYRLVRARRNDFLTGAQPDFKACRILLTPLTYIRVGKAIP